MTPEVTLLRESSEDVAYGTSSKGTYLLCQLGSLIKVTELIGKLVDTFKTSISLHHVKNSLYLSHKLRNSADISLL